MHKGVLVIIDKPDDTRRETIEEIITMALKPFEEGSGGGEWDWWQIGGRWTGCLTGYDPEADPDNRENLKPKWPTEWKEYEGDVLPIEEVTQEVYDKNFHDVCYCVQEYGHRYFPGDRYEPWQPQGENFPKQDLPPLDWLKKEFKGCLAVVVDCHY